MAAKHRVIYFDFETAGLQPRHPEIQLAAIATEDFEEVECFERKIVFDATRADPEALAINSYDAAVWGREAKQETDVVAEFSSFLRKHATLERTSKKSGKGYRIAWLAGHNIASFDVPRLAAMWKRHDAFLAADTLRPLDTMQLAWWCSAAGLLQTESYRQVDLCHLLGIDATGAHDALTDVRMCAKLSKALHETMATRGS